MLIVEDCKFRDKVAEISSLGVFWPQVKDSTALAPW